MLGTQSRFLDFGVQTHRDFRFVTETTISTTLTAAKTRQNVRPADQAVPIG
jgi:hypothetical protein